MIVGLRYALTAEGVCRYYVGSYREIFPVNVLHHMLTSDVEHVVVALHLSGGIGKSCSSEIVFIKSVTLYHGSHGTIEHHDTLLDNIL